MAYFDVLTTMRKQAGMMKIEVIALRGTTGAGGTREAAIMRSWPNQNLVQDRTPPTKTAARAPL
jgi:hypothetical protein